MDNPTLKQFHNNLLEKLRHQHLLDNSSVDTAFSAVPRHLFLPHIDPEQAYQDNAIPIKFGSDGETLSSSSQPTMMAIMFQQMALEQGMNVLEIGTATGYNAALMKHIVGARGHVTSLEIDNDLSNQARDNLTKAGYATVNVVNADAVNGYSPRAQYDRIISTVGVWDIPPTWTQQIRHEGRLIVPIWLDGVQVSATFTPQADSTFLSTDNRPCAFVYLRGVAEGPRVRKQVGSTSMMILADEVDKIDTAALHLLLSDDLEIHSLGIHLKPEDYWYGFQMYLMLNEPKNFVFSMYSIPSKQKAYGMDGSGIFLFTPTSVAFAGYHEGGTVHSFGGADAFLEMQTQLKKWIALDRPKSNRLSLRLIPIDKPEPQITQGKLYTRKYHYLHVWQN
jgi:protein-L-isoaspartate(D-aspartate) O-methyltransferase